MSAHNTRLNSHKKSALRHIDVFLPHLRDAVYFAVPAGVLVSVGQVVAAGHDLFVAAHEYASHWHLVLVECLLGFVQGCLHQAVGLLFCKEGLREGLVGLGLLCFLHGMDCNRRAVLQIQEFSGKAMQRNSFQATSESSNSKKKAQPPEKKSLLYGVDWFPITTSPWIASMAFLPYILFIIHCFDFYSSAATKVFKSKHGVVLVAQFITADIASIAYVLNLILSILSLLSLFFSRNQLEGFKYILGWVGSKLFPALRYIIEINVAIAGWFLIRSPPVAIFFALAAFVNLFVNFLAQNYTLRKDYLCCKSMEFLMLFKSTIIFAYGFNCLGYYIIKQSFSLFVVFLVVQLLLASILFVSFFVFGYLTYRHTASQVSLVAILCLYLSVTMGNLYDCAISYSTNRQGGGNQNLIAGGCLFVCLSVVSLSLWSKLKRIGSDARCQNLHKKIFFIFNKLQNSSESINDDCEIRGIIRHHLSEPCPNQECFTHRLDGDYYDAKKNKYCFSGKLNQGKTSFVKFIIKCLYEQELELARWSDTDLLLEYIEFFYMKLKNLFRVSILLCELNKKFLTPFQKLRLGRLRRVMLEETLKINQELYAGCLDIENLIVSEAKFDEIRQQLHEVLQRNLKFWNYIENDSVNLSTMARIMKPNFQLIEQINANWKHVGKYFQIQKVWKFYFACYTLYIKNEKLKPQFLECFGQSVHEEDIFLMESQHIDKTTDTEKLFISKMIFEQDSCCIHIDNNEDRLTIKSVSRYFERIFGYQSHEILQSSLNVMMLPSFRAFHLKRFLAWAGDGKSNNENAYSTKKVFPRDVNGFIVPTFKFYKQFLCLNRQLQYVAMFKKNREQEHIIILNQHFQIEGMTNSVARRLRIIQSDYDKLIGLNIIIFMRDLVYFTKYEEDKTHLDEELQINEDRPMLHTHNRFMLSSSDNKSKTNSRKNNYTTKKEFTKNNILMVFPLDFENLRNTYLSLRKDQTERSKIYEAIHKAQNVIREQGEQSSFRVEIQVRHIQVGNDYNFIELYLREVQSIKKRAHESEDHKKQDHVMERHIDGTLSQNQFQKFFESSQNSENISLAFTDNIFIKEENNQSVQMISHVRSISVSVRIIFVFFFILLLVSLLFEYRNYNSYEDNALKLKALVLFHLKALMITNKYHSIVLGLPPTMQSLQKLTTDLRAIRRQLEFKQVILDSSINQEATYIQYGQGEHFKFDQIDLIDRIYENAIEIWYSHGGLIDSTYPSYQEHEKLVVPSLQTLTTKAEQKLDERFTTNVQNTKIKNTVYVVIGVLLLVAGFILVFTILIRITRSFVCLMEIFTHFSETDLKKIIRYCQYLSHIFAHLGLKYDSFTQVDGFISGTLSFNPSNPSNHNSRDDNSNLQSNNPNNMLSHMSSTPSNIGSNKFEMSGANFMGQMEAGIEQKSDIDNANLNKKVKKVENGRQLTNLKLKSIVLLVIFLLIFGLSSFGLNLYIGIVNDEVKDLENTAFFIFSFYSVTNIQMLKLKDRAISQAAFQAARYAPYEKKIYEMKNLKNTSPKPMSVEFASLRDKVMFGNICKLFPEVVTSQGYTVNQCLEVSENNLQHGVQSYMFYLVNTVDLYMESSSYTLDTDVVNQLEKGLDISNLFFEYMAEQWAAGFQASLNTLKSNIVIICSSLILFQIIIYVVLIEVLIVGNLKGNFIFFRQIYEGLMPDFIVTKEKIIKAKLEVEGIIKK